MCQLGIVDVGWGTLNRERGTAPTETCTRSEACGQRSLAGPADEAWNKVCAGVNMDVDVCSARSGGGVAIWRIVTLPGEDCAGCGSLKEPIWPVWVPESGSDKALANFEANWANASAQARATAKWIATILGVALAALIGSAPLSGIRNEDIPLLAYVTGGIGLACIAFTLFLVVCVLVPQITGFEDLLNDKGAFKDLRKRFEYNAGILLPLRVRTFAELGGRTRLEARTLDEIEKKIGTYRGKAFRKAEFKAYCDAQAGRSKWLSYLVQTSTQWAAIASYQEVKRRAELARNAGIASGVLGTALIVVAFLMPTPRNPAVNLNTYKLAHGAATAVAQTIIGDRCATFRGVVVHVDSSGDLKVLVQPTGVCNSAVITVPAKDLVQTS
jgi:hypothetical protein